MYTPTYKSKLGSIFAFSLLLTATLYPSAGYSQKNKNTIIDNPIISDQTASDSAAVILSNIQLIADINEGKKLELVPTTSTIIADTEAALAVLRTYQNYKIETTQSILKDLHLSLKSIKVKLAYANKVGNNSYITELTKLEDDAVAKITAAKAQLVSSKVAATNVSTGLRVLKGFGIGLSVAGTAIEGKRALEELKKDAASLQSTLSQAKFVFSAASTSLVIVGAKLAPQVALVQVATDVTVAYIDFLGGAVHTESHKRIEAIYSAINTAHIQVQNRIKSHYLAGKTLTDEEASAIATLEYQKVKDFILQFKDDVGIMEWLYRINKSDKKAINDAIYQVNFLLDGKAKDRAIKFNDEIRDIFEENAKLSAIIDKSVASLNLENLTISSPNFGPIPITCPKSGCDFIYTPPNIDVPEKESLPETVTLTPTPPAASGRFFGLLSYFAENTNTFTPNGGTPQQPQFNRLEDDDQIINSQVPDGKATQYGENPGNTGPLRFSNAWPDDEENEYTEFNTANDVTVTGTRYGPGVFTNLVGKPYDSYQYKHTAWGKWNGDVADIDIYSTGNGINKIVRRGTRGYWVVGENTLSKTIADRTGEAEYKGAFIGDYVAAGSSVVQQGVAYGTVNYKMNFGDDKETGNRLTGNSSINLKLQDGTFVSDWFSPLAQGANNLGNGLISPNILEDNRWFNYGDNDEENVSEAEWKNKLTTAQKDMINAVGPVFILEKDGSNWSSETFGMFYGNTGSEVGGILDIEKRDGPYAGEVNGIFRAVEQLGPGDIAGGSGAPGTTGDGNGGSTGGTVVGGGNVNF